MAFKKIELNGFERMIAKVSPGLAKRRAGNRIQLNQLTTSERGYDAGRKSRATAGWKTPRSSSANSEILFELSWLRERSRDLRRNNPYALKALRVITNNINGTGIKPSIPKGVMSKRAETRLMAGYRMWAETTMCDYNNQLNLYGLVDLAISTAAESGDAVFFVVRDAKRAIPICLRLYEPDYLDDSKDGMPIGDGGYILGGVEFDKYHKRVAYWMFDRHPSDMIPMAGDYLSKRYLAEDIVHVYEVLRAGQIRGIPMGVSTFLRIKGLDDYEDAQLTSQIVASCFSVFVRKTDPMDIGNPGESKDLPPLSEKVSPGMIEYLAPGEDVSFATPPGVQGSESHIKSIGRSIAAGHLITYEQLTGDFSNVNFTSYRAGLNESHKQVLKWQYLWIIPMVMQPIWEHFCVAATFAGYHDGKTVAPQWTAPKPSLLDPYREAKGYEALIRLGVYSRGEVVRLLGYDPEKVLAEVIDEQKEQNAAGLMLTSDPRHDANRVNFGPDVFLEGKRRPEKPASKSE